MENYQELNFINVLSTKNNQVGSLVGSTDFIYTCSSDHANLPLKHSYFTIAGTIKSTGNQFTNTSVNDTLPTNMGICSNPAAALFSTADLTINNVLTQRIEAFPIHSCVNKMLDSTYEVELSSGSPYLLSEPSSGPFIIAPGNVINLHNRNWNTRKRNCQIFLRDNTSLITDNSVELDSSGNGLRFQISYRFPFLDTNDSNTSFMHGNSKYHVSYQTNPSWRSDLFVGLSPASVALLDINITDFEWCIGIFKSSIPKFISQTVNFTQTYTYRANHTGTTYTIQIPSSTHQVVFYLTFGSGSTYTSVAAGPPIVVSQYLLDTMLPSAGSLVYDEPNFAPVGVPAINNCYINLNSKNYPSNYYSLANGTELTTVADSRRAYNDYKRFSLSHQNNEAPLIRTYKEWLSNPLFVFDTKPSMNTSNGTSTLTIYVNPGPSGTIYPQQSLTTAGNGYNTTVNLNVCCFFNKRLIVDYGEYGEVVNTQVLVEA